MKNIAKRLSEYFMVCIMILFVCGSINKVLAYEFIATINGEVLKIDVQDVTYKWRKNIRGKPLKVTGKVSKGEFTNIEWISSECELLDMSDLEIDVIPHQSFIERNNLRVIILPKKLKEIEPCCFSGCYNLETVVLPESLREIGHGSFQSCPRLKMQVSSWIKFTDDDFYRSPGVTIVEVEPEVPSCRFCSWVWDCMGLGGIHDQKKYA